MNSQPEPPITQDRWLTETLGVPTFRVNSPEAPIEAGFSGDGFFYAKIPTNDAPALGAFTKRGFKVIETSVTLTFDFSTVGVAHGQNGVTVAQPDQHEALIDIAARSFVHSRFHRDPLITRQQADKVKAEWVRSYTEGKRGTELLAATQDGEPAGFLCVLQNPEGVWIDLIAVAPEHQGKGVGTRLVQAFQARWWKQHGPPLKVGTQLSNSPSLRLYGRHGFRADEAKYVLHLHRSA